MDEKKTTKKATPKKAPVERTVVKASTGEKVSGGAAVISAGNKKKATGLRWGAVILWLLGIGFEAAGILLLNGILYIPGNLMTWIIVALAIDLVLVIIASQLWKKANRLDPASEKSKIKFFLWNNMGVIVSAIAFAPIIILLLKTDNLDKKSKKIVTVIAVIAMLIAGAASVDYNPASAEDLAAAQQQVGSGVVYWTQWGRSYHLDPNCHTLSRSATLYEGTVEEAFEAKRNDPCDFCALNKNGGEEETSGGDELIDETPDEEGEE